MDAVSELVLDALGAHVGHLPRYSSALRRACEDNPPPYGRAWFGERFRQHACDSSNLANLLASDVHMEGYSAGRLWEFAHAVPDRALSLALQAHAVDEARHSRLFAALLLSLFPSAASESLRSTLSGMAPRLAPGDSPPSRGGMDPPTESELLGSFVMINLYEAKALVLEKLLEPVLVAYATPAMRPKVSRGIRSIIHDEARHILYTAEYVERAMTEGDPERVEDMMSEFQWALNKVTLDDVASGLPDGGAVCTS